jgi:hypothetical protein
LTYLTFEPEDGRTLSYQRRGSGPLVVCIPGGPGMDPDAYFAGLELPSPRRLPTAPIAWRRPRMPATRSAASSARRSGGGSTER